MGLLLRIYGDPVLRTRAREFSQGEIDAGFHALVEDMAETMYEASGIGLAANQIGELRRFFLADWAQAGDAPRKNGKRVKDPAKRELHVFINPTILDSSPEDGDYNEGCLSIPELEADVFRPLRIRVAYRTLEWEERTEWLEGLAARVFQHELDHLDGILFIDRLPESQRQRMAGALNRIKKQSESPAETATAGPR